MQAYLFTNQGGRHHNEDSADFCQLEDRGCFAVADGLGGIKGGEAASACVIEKLMNDWRAAEGDWDNWMEPEITQLNEQVLQLQSNTRGSMKSTVTMLITQEEDFYWASVGDTRLYCLENGEIRQITSDHSVTYKKFLAGQISRNAINFDEDRSSLLRAVGDVQRCRPDHGCVPGGVKPGSAFLLCTDGFWEYLFDEEILLDRLKSDTPRQWVEYMLLRVMERLTPGTDNLTALAVMV